MLVSNVFTFKETYTNYLGVCNTYNRLHDNYYGITEAQVEWVLKRCTICTLQAANKGKPPLKPIKVQRCLNHFLIDLMDFRS